MEINGRNTSNNINNNKYLKFAYNFNSPISSFANDKECKLYIVGGRDCNDNL